MCFFNIVLSMLVMFLVVVHCQLPANDRIRGIDPIDTLGLGASSFDLSQVHDVTQPVSNTETLQQRRERLAAELAALDQVLEPSSTGIGGTGRRRNRQRSGARRGNRQRNTDILIDPLLDNSIGRRNRQRDTGILIDPGHDHSHGISPTGRGNRQQDRGILIDSGHDHAHLDPVNSLDRKNRRPGRNGLSGSGVGGRGSGHHTNFDAFLDRVLGPVGSGGDLIPGQGRIDRPTDTHGHLDATHAHSTDIRPTRRRDRHRHQETAAGHAGHDHGSRSPGHQDGRFDAFLDNVLGPETNTNTKPIKKAQHVGKGKQDAGKNTGNQVHTDHHDHAPKTNTRQERQNQQQNGIRGFLQNLLLGELSRRLTGPRFGPRFGPQPFNPFVQRRPQMFILG